MQIQLDESKQLCRAAEAARPQALIFKEFSSEFVFILNKEKKTNGQFRD
jgi:hypothetical protein